MKNFNCDGEKCRSENGEVRVLPLGGGGNLILCFDCFNYEIRFRRELNRKLGEERHQILDWKELKVYSNI